MISFCHDKNVLHCLCTLSPTYMHHLCTCFVGDIDVFDIAKTNSYASIEKQVAYTKGKETKFEVFELSHQGGAFEWITVLLR